MQLNQKLVQSAIALHTSRTSSTNNKNRNKDQNMVYGRYIGRTRTSNRKNPKHHSAMTNKTLSNESPPSLPLTTAQNRSKPRKGAEKGPYVARQIRHRQPGHGLIPADETERGRTTEGLRGRLRRPQIPTTTPPTPTHPPTMNPHHHCPSCRTNPRTGESNGSTHDTSTPNRPYEAVDATETLGVPARHFHH